jgi:excisionase family DNA binding protein
MLRIADAADILGVSSDTIRRRIADGRLRAVKSGRIVRIDERDLQAFIAASRRWR